MAMTTPAVATAPVINAHSVSFLRGSFQKQYPEPTVFSWRKEGKWLVVKAGPRYCHVYEIDECDEAGERWLIEHEAPAADEKPK